MENLPNELHEEIYKQLCIEDLMSMMLVNSHSKRIIENSPSLMRKLPIYIVDNENDEFSYETHKEDIEPLLVSNRKSTKIIVRLRQDKIMRFLGIFKTFSKTIRYLEIDDYIFDTLDQFRIVLRFLSNLQTLKVQRVRFLKPENEYLNSIVRVPKLSLKELRNVECIDCESEIFTLFENNNDVNFREIRLTCDVFELKFTKAAAFLGQQRKLTSLRLDSVSLHNCDIFTSDNALGGGELRKLAIVKCSFSDEQMRRLMSAIKSQPKLMKLEFIHTKIPQSIDVLYFYRQIILTSTLKELHFDIKECELHSHELTNTSVTDLKIYGNFAFELLPIFVNFIKIFKNVERLWIKGNQGIGDKYLFHILTAYPNLEFLHVPGFTSRAMDSNFSNLSNVNVNLKTLILDKIDYSVKFFGWKNLVSNLKSIEKLVIKNDYGKVSNEIVDVIVKTLNLKHLELGNGVVSEEILRNIMYNSCCEELRVLKIARDDFQKISDKFDFRKMFEKNRLLLDICDADYFLLNCLE